jgi:predicted enzyme related to lactoylglutathione lyase
MMKNTFGWVQLATTDPKAARMFYENLFRWRITHQECDGHKGFLEIDAGEGPCAGIDQGEEGKGSHWIPFVSVGDIHESTNKAKDLGAQILVPVMDLGHDQGFISVFVDPTGAVLGMHARK